MPANNVATPLACRVIFLSTVSSLFHVSYIIGTGSSYVFSALSLFGANFHHVSVVLQHNLNSRRF